jgi:Family of unknown function (DUF5684)
MTALTYSTTSSGGSAAFLIWLYLAVYVLLIIGFWVTFTKAGEAGWKSIIPIYNTIIWLKIIGHPWWWILLLLIPIVNIVILIFMWNGLSKSFGKGAGFTVGLIFLPYVFVPILGLGPARYVGPSGAPLVPPTPPPMPV